MNSLRLWFQETVGLMPPPKYVTDSFHPLNQGFLPSTEKSTKASVEFNAEKRNKIHFQNVECEQARRIELESPYPIFTLPLMPAIVLIAVIEDADRDEHLRCRL
jgi:hypothetical protein